MHNPMQITGISASSTVFFNLFIQSTLVKKQRLNIRIYSVRKTIIFITVYILHKIPLHLKNSVICKTVLDDNFLYNLFCK